MDIEIQIALIGAIPAIVAVILSNRALTIQLEHLKEQLNKLEKKVDAKVDADNNFQVRIAKLEQHAEDMKA